MNYSAMEEQEDNQGYLTLEFLTMFKRDKEMKGINVITKDMHIYRITVSKSINCTMQKRYGWFAI